MFDVGRPQDELSGSHIHALLYPLLGPGEIMVNKPRPVPL